MELKNLCDHAEVMPIIRMCSIPMTSFTKFNSNDLVKLTIEIERKVSLQKLSAYDTETSKSHRPSTQLGCNSLESIICMTGLKFDVNEAYRQIIERKCSIVLKRCAKPVDQRSSSKTIKLNNNAELRQEDVVPAALCNNPSDVDQNCWMSSVLQSSSCESEDDRGNVDYECTPSGSNNLKLVRKLAPSALQKRLESLNKLRNAADSLSFSSEKKSSRVAADVSFNAIREFPNKQTCRKSTYKPSLEADLKKKETLARIKNKTSQKLPQKKFERKRKKRERLRNSSAETQELQKCKEDRKSSSKYCNNNEFIPLGRESKVQSSSSKLSTRNNGSNFDDLSWSDIKPKFEVPVAVPVSVIKKLPNVSESPSWPTCSKIISAFSVADMSLLDDGSLEQIEEKEDITVQENFKVTLPVYTESKPLIDSMVLPENSEESDSKVNVPLPNIGGDVSVSVVSNRVDRNKDAPAIVVEPLSSKSSSHLPENKTKLDNQIKVKDEPPDVTEDSHPCKKASAASTQPTIPEKTKVGLIKVRTAADLGINSFSAMTSLWNPSSRSSPPAAINCSTPNLVSNTQNNVTVADGNLQRDPRLTCQTSFVVNANKVSQTPTAPQCGNNFVRTQSACNNVSKMLGTLQNKLDNECEKLHPRLVYLLKECCRQQCTKKRKNELCQSFQQLFRLVLRIVMSYTGEDTKTYHAIVKSWLVQLLRRAMPNRSVEGDEVGVFVSLFSDKETENVFGSSMKIFTLDVLRQRELQLQAQASTSAMMHNETNTNNRSSLAELRDPRRTTQPLAANRPPPAYLRDNQRTISTHQQTRPTRPSTLSFSAHQYVPTDGTNSSARLSASSIRQSLLPNGTVGFHPPATSYNSHSQVALYQAHPQNYVNYSAPQNIGNAYEQANQANVYYNQSQTIVSGAYPSHSYHQAVAPQQRVQSSARCAAQSLSAAANIVGNSMTNNDIYANGIYTNNYSRPTSSMQTTYSEQYVSYNSCHAQQNSIMMNSMNVTYPGTHATHGTNAAAPTQQQNNYSFNYRTSTIGEQPLSVPHVNSSVSPLSGVISTEITTRRFSDQPVSVNIVQSTSRLSPETITEGHSTDVDLDKSAEKSKYCPQEDCVKLLKNFYKLTTSLS